jgi:glutathione synthase/RimK-type ligase-like ATP-grasp enzyme
MPFSVLIITEPGDVHADEVIRELSRRDIAVFRFHPEDFPQAANLTFEICGGCLNGEIITPYRSIAFNDISAVWYRRPNNPILHASLEAGAVEFAQVQARYAIRTLSVALESALWVNRPAALRLAEIKALQLLWASRVGLLTPQTLISNDSARAHRFYHDLKLRSNRCAVKPLQVLGAATSDGWRFPLTTLLPDDYALDALCLAPMIFQPYIEKAAELRCVVMGDSIFPVRIDSQRHSDTAVDWRGGSLEHLDDGLYELITLPAQVENSIRQLMQYFDIVFASIDMIITPEGEYVFLELNPNGQWLWLEDELGIPLVASMADLLTSRIEAPGSRI